MEYFSMKIFRKSLMKTLFPFMLACASIGTANAAYVCRLNPYGDDFLSLRKCPKTKCAEMLRLGPGTDVDVLDSSGKWRKVRLNNGAVGWVSGKYLCY
jgi:SH3-like domain-containing protein